jgi:hypothetical protein
MQNRRTWFVVDTWYVPVRHERQLEGMGAIDTAKALTEVGESCGERSVKRVHYYRGPAHDEASTR